MSLLWVNADYLHGFLTTLKGQPDHVVRDAFNQLLGPGSRPERIARVNELFEHLERGKKIDNQKAQVHGAFKVLLYGLC